MAAQEMDAKVKLLPQKILTHTNKPKSLQEIMETYLNSARITSNTLLQFMVALRRTTCEKRKLDLVKKSTKMMQSISFDLMFSSMKSAFLAPLFKEVVQLAVPSEFNDREHFLFEKDDFLSLTNRTESVLNFLYTIFDICCKNGGTDTKPLDDSLPLLILVISSNIRNSLWSKDSLQKLTLLVLNQLRILYKVDSLAELLLLDVKSGSRVISTPTSCVLGRYLQFLKSRMSKEKWQANPTFVESFFWTLTKMMRFPHLSDYLDIVLPPALMLVDNHVTSNKVMGIQCLQHIAANVTKDQLRWFGRADVVFAALKHNIYSREPNIIHALHPALLTILPIVDHDPAKPSDPSSPRPSDAILSIIVTCAATENGIVMRRTLTSRLAEFADAMGISVVRHLSQLISLVFDYLEVFDGPEEETRFNILSLLKSLLRNAWPRIPAHSSTILKCLLKLIQDVELDRTTTSDEVKDKLKEEAVLCLQLLQELCPDVASNLGLLCEIKELSYITRVINQQ